ncbi:hypothetical protein OUZ56_017428 [Daphnia magna]|uniref:Uncharacterized protein n=1 Tax=Daphnia magna TaxID=35525 RepID=A0ABR0AT81_9CRUS|nr:hypothetical protein OUZ56_017428 [Daphnia magna]
MKFFSPGSTEILPRPLEAVDPRVLPTALFPLDAMGATGSNNNKGVSICLQLVRKKKWDVKKPKIAGSKIVAAVHEKLKAAKALSSQASPVGDEEDSD